MRLAWQIQPDIHTVSKTRAEKLAFGLLWIYQSKYKNYQHTAKYIRSKTYAFFCASQFLLANRATIERFRFSLEIKVDDIHDDMAVGH